MGKCFAIRLLQTSNYIVDIKSDNVKGVSRNGVLYDSYDCDWT